MALKLVNEINNNPPTDLGPQAGVQLPYKWLNSMVGRYNYS